MRAKMVSMALLVAALMGASMSVSAKGRRAEFVKGRKADFRKEIRFNPCNCPRCMEMRKRQALHFDARFRDPRFMDARFKEARFRDARMDKSCFEKGKHHRHGKKFHRR